MKSSFPYHLYLVISNEDCKNKNLLEVAEQSILGGVDIIQLREKHASTPAFTEQAKRLKEITERYNVPLIINDNLEVVNLAGTTGIHVGNTDIAPVEIRRQTIGKELLIGYSIEYIEQLYNEHTKASDYLGISPVFSTPTKRDTVTQWGLAGISEIRSLTDKPLVGIGGINLQNARSIIDAGADCIAVVSAICGSDNPQKAAYQLKNEVLK